MATVEDFVPLISTTRQHEISKRFKYDNLLSDKYYCVGIFVINLSKFL